FLEPKLLLTPTELLNDPNEGVHFFEILKTSEDGLEVLVKDLDEHRRGMRATLGLRGSDPLVFVASLCMEHDNLNLWRFYGGARGVSFGVHRSQFDLTTEEGLSDGYARDKLYRVKYGKDAVESALSHLTPSLAVLAKIYKARVTYRPHITKSVSGLLETVAYLFKHASYEAEKECRLLRIQSIGDVRAGPHAMAINSLIRVQSNVGFVHAGPPHPKVTLGPQFDSSNPERGQTKAIDRMFVALPDRQPTVRLSEKRFRAPEKTPVPQ
ncbi:MAG TPA: DUF2971 domain-containing protein, partial [Sphingomicrobium sp.]